MTASTPAPRPGRPRPLARAALLALVALVALLGPGLLAGSPTSGATDDAPGIELVAAPHAEDPDTTDHGGVGATDPSGKDPVLADDALAHPDLEPHDGPPPLRGPPAG